MPALKRGEVLICRVEDQTLAELLALAERFERVRFIQTEEPRWAWTTGRDTDDTVETLVPVVWLVGERPNRGEK